MVPCFLTTERTDNRDLMESKISVFVRISDYPLHYFSYIGDAPRDGGSGGGERAGEESAPAFALASFKVAIARRYAVLTRLQFVAIHGDAHTAAGLTPVAPGGAENLRQAFADCLTLDVLRSGHHQHPHLRISLAAFENGSGSAEVFNARVCAAS